MKLLKIFLLILLSQSVVTLKINCEEETEDVDVEYGYCTIDPNEHEDITEIKYNYTGGEDENYVRRIDKEVRVAYKLTNFPSLICGKFVNLKEITLPRVSLENIDENSFNECKNLEKLYLNKNWIKTLSSKLFKRTKKLFRLRLDDNRIEELPANIFDALTNLYELNLSKNPLQTFPDKIFSKLVALKILELEELKLTTLKPVWFESIINLSNLHLGENQIESLPEKVFALPTLQMITLQGNKLTTIHSNAFSENSDFKVMRFFRNQIESFDEKIFNDNPNALNFVLTDNPCVNHITKAKYFAANREELRKILSKCFENFRRDYP